MTPCAAILPPHGNIPRAGAGEFCDGIAGIMCDPELTCIYEGTYPDAGGTCVQS